MNQMYASKINNLDKRKEEIDKVLALFSPYLSLEEANGYYCEFVCGPWKIFANNCVIGLHSGVVSTKSRSFSKDATKEDILNIMNEMIEEAKGLVKAMRDHASDFEIELCSEFEKINS